MKTETTTRINAVELLKQDHEKVKGLFKEFMESGERAIKTRERLSQQIFLELEVHSKLEEEIFYPAYCQAAKEQGEDIVAESLEEHHVVDLLIGELKALTPEEENFEPKMKVLCENVQHHIEEEEQEMLNKAPRFLGDKLETLGQQMAERKKQLMGQMKMAA
jgi:hypothetical protein